VTTSALIVSYNTRELTLAAIRSVLEFASETIVVDNASRDGSADAIGAAFPDVTLIRSAANLGFAGGINRAAGVASGESLLVLNSDASLTRGALALLLELLERRPRAALVAPALRYPDGRPQPSAFRFPGLAQIALDLFPVDRLMDSRLNGRIHAEWATQIDHPLGACMLIRRVAWEDVGPLDEGYFMYLEEVDWCRRARGRGWQIWHEPRAVVVHHGGSSTRQHRGAMVAQLWRSRLRYYTRFYGPGYNRLVHTVVRLGLRGACLSSVRQLVK
jgi:N-acetylglucosaminyl-diphospho-decaprenol L-rhamnosyltransferase